MDDLIAKAAEAMKMPAAMVRRSAEARAKAEERSVEEVLAEWAGVEVPSADSDAADTDADAASAEADGSDDGAPDSAEEAPAEKPAATGVEKYVEIAAEAMKMPASMIRRSAEARARTEGRSYEEVLADWAGVDVEEVRAAAEEAEQAEATATAAEDAAPEEAPETERAETEPEGDEADTEAEPAVEDEEPAAAEPAVEVIGGDDEVAVDAEPAAEDDAALVGAGAGLPMWLLTLFVIIPAFAIGYASFFPNGPNCGDAGSLAVDPMTGLAVNCDGTEYGEIGVDFFAMGADVYAVCAGCHGQGGGGGAGPAFIGGAVLATFPEGQCDMHVEWIRLGTQGWPEPTYGANQKPVGGFGAPMPGFGSLSDEELSAVALYERVQFGGEALEAALVDCGLVDGDNGDGDEDAPPADE